MSTDLTKPELDSAALRPWAELLALWRLCHNARCRRSQACRCNARHCFRNAVLLPEGVRAWIAGLARAQDEGMSFDEAMQFLDGTDAGDALRNWQHAVAASLGRDAKLPVRWWSAE